MGLTKCGRQITSLFTDASFCHESGCGGWGGWVKSDYGSDTFGGIIEHKFECKSSGHAELMAIAKGIKTAYTLNLLREGDCLILKSDSLEALRLIEMNTKIDANKHEHAINVSILVNRFLKRKNIQLRASHVKGHNKDGKPSSWVNNKCDKIAKYFMRKYRKEVKDGK